MKIVIARLKEWIDTLQQVSECEVLAEKSRLIFTLWIEFAKEIGNDESAGNAGNGDGAMSTGSGDGAASTGSFESVVSAGSVEGVASAGSG